VVYVVQAGKEGPVKIGWTKGPVEKRLGMLQVGCPDLLNLLYVFVKGDRNLEKFLHRRLHHHWYRGEWYYYDEEMHKFLDVLDKIHRGLPYARTSC
jgi:hypothetical protein